MNHSVPLRRYFLRLLATASLIPVAFTPVAAQPQTTPFTTLPQDIDRFPYPASGATFLIPADLRPANDHYFICTAMIDTMGLVVAASALGCDSDKGSLCDYLDSLIPAIPFVPARKRGLRASVTVVFPALVPAAPDSVGSFGPPVVGEWEEGQCDYTGRIYGADELEEDARPQVITKPEVKYPTTARLTGQSGDALINMIVGPDGLPCFVLCEAVRPVGMGFAEAAVRAAWQYRFIPGMNRGEAQAVWVKIPFRWRP